MVVTWSEIEFLRHLELEEPVQKNTVKNDIWGILISESLLVMTSPDAVWGPPWFPRTPPLTVPRGTSAALPFTPAAAPFLAAAAATFPAVLEALKGLDGVELQR